MVNNCCWKGYVRKFCKIEKDEWLAKMVKHYHRAAPESLPSAEVIKSWENEFDVLRQTFAALPKEYGGLFLFFEYAIPVFSHTGDILPNATKRPDVIVVSKDTATVLEFKQRTVPYGAAINQTKAYRKKIKRYHDASRGMTKRAVAVFTAGTALRGYDQIRKVHTASPDTLAEVLYDIYQDEPAGMTAEMTSIWQRTTYSDHRADRN